MLIHRGFLTASLVGSAAMVASNWRNGATHETPSRPNIFWLDSEDANVKWIGCYGNTEFDVSGPDVELDCVIDLYDFASFASQ